MQAKPSRLQLAVMALSAAAIIGIGAAALAQDPKPAPSSTAPGAKSSLSAPEYAGLSEAEESRMLQSHADITSEQASKIASDAVEGTVHSVELENENGSVVFGIEMENEDGEWIEVIVDAGTGEILSRQIENDIDEEGDVAIGDTDEESAQP